MSKIVKAYAKINLTLFITGKLPNGYHTLETIFAPINWYDTLRLEPSDALEMTCTNANLPVDDTNLCIKAAKVLRGFSGTTKGVKITLEKNVPFGAGLGGGSSDAAATLKFLNAFWEINASSQDLHTMATKLGADVPYFLEMPALALGSGIGEQLTDLKLRFPFSVVTVFPKVPVPTVWAYKNFHANFSRQLPDVTKLIGEVCLTKNLSLLRQFENDFESVVHEHFPEVKALRDDLNTMGSDFTLLSGSGSAVFAVFADSDKAAQCYEACKQRFPASLTPPDFATN
jgi:4-diphosphocytidyl-2-C-methyl-D-erythritol kinase